MFNQKKKNYETEELFTATRQRTLKVKNIYYKNTLLNI